MTVAKHQQNAQGGNSIANNAIKRTLVRAGSKCHEREPFVVNSLAIWVAFFVALHRHPGLPVTAGVTGVE